MKTSFEYELTTPFKYGDGKGELVDAMFIQFNAPTSKHMQHTAFLKQAFYRALPKDQTDEADETSEKEVIPSGKEVMAVILMSRDVELANLLVCARELFSTKGVALVDGETHLTKPLIDEMSQDDLENCLGEYLVNFVLASVWQTQNKR